MCKKVWYLFEKDQEELKTDYLSLDPSSRTGQAIVTKFYDKIIHLKEMCTHVDIILNSWETKKKAVISVIRL